MFSESWQILSIAISVLGAAIQIAGIASPLWIWIEDGDEHIGIGLFYRIGFESDGVVTIPDDFAKIKFDSDQTIDTTHWTVMLSMEVISTAMAVILIPMLFLFYIRTKAEPMKMYGVFRACLWVCIFACIFNGVGLMVFIIYHGDILTEGPDVSNKTFSWGGLICGCGVLLHFCLTLIIYQCIWPDETIIPASADPKMTEFTPTTNANISQVFGSYYNKNANEPPTPGIGDNFRQAQDTRLPIMPPSRDLHRPESIPNGQVLPYSRARMPPPPPPVTNDFRRPSTEGRRVDSVYGNLPTANRQADFDNQRSLPNANRQADFDNRGFVHSSPLGRRPDFQRQTTTTILERHDEFDNVRRGFEEEVVFNRAQQNRNDQRRSSIYRDLYNLDETKRKSSRDFLVTAKHGAERGVHRDNSRSMSHTNKPSEDSTIGQRLALSPSNFTESNIKYNPKYMYRPFSETVY